MSEKHSSDRHKTREPGVYWRKVRGGKSYMFSYEGSDGRQHWKTVGPSFEEAVAARNELRKRKRDGSPIRGETATVFELARAWLEASPDLGERTVEEYERALRRVGVLEGVGDQQKPGPLGRRRAATVTTADVGAIVAKLRGQGLSAWTIRGTITPLSGLFTWAEEEGYVASNVVRRFTAKGRRGRKAGGGLPTPKKRQLRILDREEIAALLEHALPGYRTLLAAAIGTGLRQSELLGLTWADVDLETSEIHVREQLARTGGKRKELKTDAAIRDVTLFPELKALLAAHKASSPYSKATDYVFTTATGKPLSWSNVDKRGLHKATERAGIEPRPRFHDLRDTFASLLIAEGEDPVSVSRQLGHARSSITLDVYAGLFEKAKRAEERRERLSEVLGPAYAAVAGGNPMVSPTVSRGSSSVPKGGGKPHLTVVS